MTKITPETLFKRLEGDLQDALYLNSNGRFLGEGKSPKKHLINYVIPSIERALDKAKSYIDLMDNEQ